MKKLDPKIEALTEQYNIFAMFVAAAVSFALQSPLCLLIAIFLEVAYILFIADSPGYKRIVAERQAKIDNADQEQKRKQFREKSLQELDGDATSRYRRLLSTRDRIANTASQNGDWYGDIMSKLDTMLDRFLVYSTNEQQFKSHLINALDEARKASGKYTSTSSSSSSTKKQRNDFDLNIGSSSIQSDESSAKWVKDTVKSIVECYGSEVEQIRTDAENAVKDNITTPGSATLIQKRIEMIQSRIQSIAKIGDSLIELTHRARLLEDTFGYISDKVSSQSPGDVVSDIDDLVMQTNLTADTLEQMQPYEQNMIQLTA